jgi:Lon protease-like protein
MPEHEIPLFPLNTVLFPSGVLPLRIFEPRYLSMVSECMKSGSGFGVVAIQKNGEAGSEAGFQKTGTLARIVDFDLLEDGLLGITCQGEQRLQVMSHRIQADQLILGRVEFLPADPLLPPLPVHDPLLDFLRHILNQEELQFYTRFLNEDWDSATWVGNRVAELLPLPLPIKQVLLELDDPIQRLDVLRSLFRNK